MTPQSFEEYRVSVEIVFSDGSVLDVTDYVREIQIVYSLNLAIPEVAIIFQRPITKLEQSIEVVNLKVETYKHMGSIVHTDRYKLVPSQTHHIVDAPLQSVQQTLNQEGFNVSDRVVLFFYIKSVYDTVNSTVGPVIKFNTSLQDVLNEILPSNCELQLQSGLETNKVLPQVFVKKQPFLSAINYLKYWYGLSKGPVCSVVVPKLDDTEDVDKTVLLLDDINVSLTQTEKYRLELVVRTSSKETEQAMTQEFEGTKFVIDYPVHFTTKVVNPVEYTFVIKPYKKLYQKLVLDEIQLINQYGAANKGYFPEVENSFGYQLREKRLVNTHTGFDESFSPLTSMFAYEYMFNVRGLIQLESIPTFRSLWPSDHVKLTIQNPEFSDHSGLYIVESVLYRLTREESREWQLGVELSVVRSNAYYQQTTYSTHVEQPATSLKVPDLSGLSSEVEQLDQTVQSVTNTIQDSVSQLGDLQGHIESYSSKVTELQESINKHISDGLDTIQATFDRALNAASLDELNSCLDDILSHVDNVTNKVNHALDHINSILATVEQVKQTYERISQTIEDIVSQVTNVQLPTLPRVLQDIEKYDTSYISFVLSSILSRLGNVRNVVDLLPAYSKDYVDSIRSTIQEAINSVRAKYEYILRQAAEVQREVGDWQIFIQRGITTLERLKELIDKLRKGLDFDLDLDVSVCAKCGDILAQVHTHVDTNISDISNHVQGLSNELIGKVRKLCKT